MRRTSGTSNNLSQLRRAASWQNRSIRITAGWAFLRKISRRTITGCWGWNCSRQERDVIDAAANRVMTYLKELAPGDDSGQSQRLLNEVAHARICLLTKDKKAAYDHELRSQLAPAEPPPLATPHAPPNRRLTCRARRDQSATQSAVGRAARCRNPRCPASIGAGSEAAGHERPRLLVGIGAAVRSRRYGDSVWSRLAKGELVIQSPEPGVRGHHQMQWRRDRTADDPGARDPGETPDRRLCRRGGRT